MISIHHGQVFAVRSSKILHVAICKYVQEEMIGAVLYSTQQ